MQLASSDDVTLTVHDLGGAGRSTLLCHATGFHGLVWTPLAEHIDGLRRWSVDFRGHGTSSAPRDRRFAWDGFADDVLTVVDGLELDRPIRVGHSMGGAALLLAEQRRPGTFAALWLFEPVVFPTDGLTGAPRANPLAEGARRRRASFPSYEAALANFASKPPMSVLDPVALEQYVRHGFAEQPDGSVELRCRPDDEAAVYDLGLRHDAFVHLGEVGCPVLVVRGDLTEPGPAPITPLVAEALPHGRLEAHDQLNHFAPLAAPERMAASVSRFVEGLNG